MREVLVADLCARTQKTLTGGSRQLVARDVRAGGACSDRSTQSTTS